MVIRFSIFESDPTLNKFVSFQEYNNENYFPFIQHFVCIKMMENADPTLISDLMIIKFFGKFTPL